LEPISLQTTIFLGIAGFVAGFVDSIAGGGGLIALPALLSTGIPPHLALGTNKMQGCFGTFTAAANYGRNNLFHFRDTIQGILYTAVGAGLGTLTIQHLSTDFLRYVIPILLLAVFLYMLLTPQIGENETSPVLSPAVFYGTAGLTLGFYDGFFGPGTGSFWMMGFILLLGINLKKATAHTKIMNFTSNIVALIFFAMENQVLYRIGLIMGIGQVLGAFAGSNLVVLKNSKLVRIFLLTVIALTILRLLITTYLNG
jgi:hypothetical protein